jgi:hypothetical protein
MRPRSSRVVVAFAVATVAALTLALGALSAPADKEQIHLTAADQASARGTVLKKADLGTFGKWTGGTLKPDLSSAPLCASFDPKQSDLVLTGVAETKFKQPGIEFDSEAQVLRAAQMVKLDWQRTVTAPGLLPCLRSVLAKNAGAAGKIVSVRRMAFPHLSQYTAAIRVLLDVKTGTSTVPVHAFVDIVFVGHGRTEITLTTTALVVNDQVTRAAEARLALIMAARAAA